MWFIDFSENLQNLMVTLGQKHPVEIMWIVFANGGWIVFAVVIFAALFGAVMRDEWDVVTATACIGIFFCSLKKAIKEI